MAESNIQINVKANTQQAQAGLQGVGKSASDLGTKMQKVGQSMTSMGQSLLPISIALAAASVGALKFATDLNEGMANVATLIPGNTARVEELKKAVQDLAIAHGKPTQDLVGGLYQTISAFGDDAAQTVKILEINSMAATAGMATTLDAINLTSAVTKGYGDTTAEAVKKASDLAFVTVKLGQTTFPELASSIGMVIPLAAKLGVSQEELFAGFATLTGVTGNASEVSTQFSAILRAMLKPTKDMQVGIAELGYASAEAMLSELGMVGALKALISTTDGSTEATAKLFGRAEALTAVFALTGKQSDTFNEKLLAMKDATGATAEAFEEQTQGINKAGFAWQQFKAQVEVAAQKLGDELLPIIMNAANELKPLGQMVLGTITGFGNLSASTKTLAIALGGILIISAPLLMFFGQLAIGISAVIPIVGTLTGAVSTLAVALGVTTGGLVFIVGAVVAAFVLLFPWLEDTTRALREQREAADNCAASVKKLEGEYISLKDAYEGVERVGGDATEMQVAHEKAVAEDTIAVIDFLKSVAPMPVVIDEVTVATQTYTKSLAEEIRETQQATKEAKIMKEAMGLLGREAEDLAEAEKTLAINVSMLNAAFDQLTPALGAHERMVFENVKQLEMAQAATLDMIRSDDDWMSTLGELDDHLEDNTGLIVEAGKEAVKAVERTTTLTRETANLTDVMSAGTRVAGDIGNALSIFGINIDSVIGKVTRLISTFESLFGSITGVMKMLSGGGVGAGGGLGLLGGLLGGGGGAGAGAAGAGAGAAGGITGAVSSGASAVMGGISTALAAIPVAGWVALAGVGIGLLARSIFSAEEWEKAGDEIGRDFGLSVSESLLKEIGDLSEEVGDRATAIQLSLGDLFREAAASGTADWNVFAEKIADTFSFLERGQITATEAQAILNDTVAQLLPHLDELGPEGQAQIDRLTAAAERFGITFEGLAELGGPIAPVVDDIASSLGVTNEEAKRLADFLGVNVRTELQKVADDLGIPPKLLKEIGAAIKDEFGIPLDGIQGLLDVMDVSIQGLGTAFGIDIPTAIGQSNTAAGDLSTTLSQIPRSIDINITEHRTSTGGGSDISAQGGFFSPSTPTDLLIQTHRGERVSVTPAGQVPAQASSQPIIVESHVTMTLDGQVVDKKIVRTVNKAGRLGDINYLGDVQTDPRA